MCASLSYLFNSSVISVQCVSFSKFVSCTPDVRLNIYMCACVASTIKSSSHAFHQFSLVIDLKLYLASGILVAAPVRVNVLGRVYE